MSGDEDNYAARAVARGEEGWPPAGELAPKSGARIEAKVDGTFEVWNGPVRIAMCASEIHANVVLEGISPRLDSRVEWTFADGLKRARAALLRMRQRSSGEPFNDRAAALVETKLDEAELWFERVR